VIFFNIPCAWSILYHLISIPVIIGGGGCWRWRMTSSGMLRRVALVRTDVSEELSASFINVTRIGELGTTLTVTSNRRTPLRCVTSQKTPFFIVTAVKTSDLTWCWGCYWGPPVSGDTYNVRVCYHSCHPLPEYFVFDSSKLPRIFIAYFPNIGI
jgi:hypothetical protein